MSAIYITDSEGQQWGPYTEAEARVHLNAGTFNLQSWAMQDGDKDWRPLGEILLPPAPAAPVAAAAPPPVPIEAGAPVAAAQPVKKKKKGWSKIGAFCGIALLLVFVWKFASATEESQLQSIDKMEEQGVYSKEFAEEMRQAIREKYAD